MGEKQSALKTHFSSSTRRGKGDSGLRCAARRSDIPSLGFIPIHDNPEETLSGVIHQEAWVWGSVISQKKKGRSGKTEANIWGQERGVLLSSQWLRATTWETKKREKERTFKLWWNLEEFFFWCWKAGLKSLFLAYFWWQKIQGSSSWFRLVGALKDGVSWLLRRPLWPFRDI